MTVVIVADENLSDQVPRYLEHLKRSRVHVVSLEGMPEWNLGRSKAMHHPARTLAHIHRALESIGPIDIIFNLRTQAAKHHENHWEKLFFHLRPGGAYVIDRQSIRSSESGTSDLGSFLRTARLLGEGLKGDDETPRLHRELARSTRQIVIGRDFVIATKRNKHYLKLRDSDASRILPTRSRRMVLREIATMPAGTFRSRAEVVSHQSNVPIAGLSETFDHPQLHLREYRGRIALVSNTLMYTEFSILPDAFRHHLASNPTNVKAINANSDFARIPDHLRPRKSLSGSYYFLDSENSGHYGHIMTDVISRLWGWDIAKAEIPDLKAIFRIRYPNERIPTLEQRIFTAYGIPKDDIVWVDEPVWLESVVGATPMWHNQARQYVHPDIAGVWSRLAKEITVGGAERSKRIFISRTTQSRYRQCRNIRDVEEFFASHGFEIVYPEDHDLGEQAAIFAKAEVIAGFGGSGLFNVLFSQSLATLIVLSPETYTARNEHLFSSVIGCKVHYFWSTPDTSHPTDGWSVEAYRSEWEFDFARNGATLARLFKSF